MDKLKMHSPDLTDQNVNKIRELFPDCVTEARDENGALRYAIDFDQLRQELSDHIVEGPQERYHLNWPGKREAILAANAPIAKTLRPSRQESVNFDTTQNLFIEGDNLEALKLLQETYLGKVKMIYIDPPYNTGNDFVYEDDFKETTDEFLLRSNQIDGEGNRLVANTTANGRFHSDWLSMMFSRLKLAKSLLSEDGVMLISIDDNESANLIRLGQEVFGSENFVAQIAVQLNPRGRNLDRFIANTHESVVVFVKDALNSNAVHGLEKEGRMVKEYNREDNLGPYRLLGLRNRNQSFNPVTRPNLYYPLYVNPHDGSVSLEHSSSYSIKVMPDAPDGVQTCWTWGVNKVKKENELLCSELSGGEYRIFRKDYLHGKNGVVAKSLAKSLWVEKEISNDYGRKAVKELFGAPIMDFPKSPYLMEKLVKMGTYEDSIVLDFFAGSGTTAHAVMQLNADDGGRRKFIMVQVPEPTPDNSPAANAGYHNIAEISKERIRRAGEAILTKEHNNEWNKDIGFRVLKVDTSNMADVYYTPGDVKQDDLLSAVDNIKPGRDNPEDLLFQVLVDLGVDLTLPIRSETVQGKTVFFVNEQPPDLIACFDAGITEELVKGLARHEPMRVVFRDNGFVSDAVKINVDIEMETGTGKTYCYIKTIFEMNKRFGWSKFIIMVPSIAIREGVYKSFQITADHFTESYGKKARFFIYNSSRLHELESFSSAAGINAMIINTQAFASKGAENRRIYDELDDFQSRKPIDVISSSRPILILDEPQKMEGAATMAALPQFNPLMILRYSATHRTNHIKVHRLDALDAYNQKLVKKISVRGIQTRGFAGTNSYLYLEGIDISKQAPVARIELEVKLKSGEIKRQLRRLDFGRDLFVESGELDQYRGFTISQIDYNHDSIEFTNGVVLNAGEATGDVNEKDIRRLQIRETIKAHLDKEKQLFSRDIKVLSLFFIDEVVKYRDYDQADEKGAYARVFEEEYGHLKEEYLAELAINNEDYRKYLAGIEAGSTHNGYFSIDRKTRRMQDPKAAARGENAGLSDDVVAYDLILKDKERLLAFDEPTRFIFSHSALREGWDNPNVFVMCMLKHSDNMISRRQEVGRGLRLSVDQHGERTDLPAIVHNINVLTVVASESYKDFVAGLQTEIAETLSARPRKANEAYFIGKMIETDDGPVEITPQTAKQIYRYVLKNDYTDDDDSITEAYHTAKNAGKLAELPEELQPIAGQIIDLIDSVFDDSKLPKIDDGRKPKTNPLNDNFEKKEFQALWSRINRKAVYRVDFESGELIRKAIGVLNSQLRITPLQYTVQCGEQHAAVTDAQLNAGESFKQTGTTTEKGGAIHSDVTYDLLGKIAENAHLTRKTVAKILTGIEQATFDQFRMNPEHFIAAASRLISEQKATAIVEQLCYDAVEDRYDGHIFTAAQTGQDFSRATAKLDKHVYDYCITDSDVERKFVEELDTSTEVVVYAKLPSGFLIPTPVGDYNPDWVISFKQGGIKHIYFVAETKGSMSSMKLREIEKTKIECARKFFVELNEQITSDKVKYDVVTDYAKLMDLVNEVAA